MLSFRLGRVPVQVHFSHLLISGLLAFSLAGSGWPEPLSPQRGAEGYEWRFGVSALAWLAIISLTVLTHELGQAWAMRAFGQQATVHLIGIGARTFVSATPLNWQQTVVSTLAGPLLGGGVALFAWTSALALESFVPSAAVLRGVLQVYAVANLAWAGFNLLPVPPLSGARILTAVLMRLLGRRGFLVSQCFSLAFAGLAGGLLLAWRKNPFIALLAGMFAFRAIALIGAYRRGEAPPLEPAALHQQELTRIEALHQEGKNDEALAALQKLGEADLAPALRAKVHLLWGWLEVKRGHGRAALDHFSQVQGMTVAPQALAAAFSLIGDDQKALPLWFDAAGSGELTLRAELGGCLMRLGRDADARKLPELRFAQSLLAAERVYFLRGEYAKAGAAAEAAFHEEPTAELAYDAACGYARAHDAEGALRMLQLASQNGFARPEVAEADSDLDSLRQHAGFVEWLAGLREKKRLPG